MERVLRILILEDLPSDAELMVFELRQAEIAHSYRRVADREPFVAALAEDWPDLILSDFHLPNFDGMEALALAQAACPDTPFIFVSGAMGEEVAIDAVLAGAQQLALGMNADRKPDAGWQRLFAESGTAEELAALVCRLDRAASGVGPLAALRRVTMATAADATGAAVGNLASGLVSAFGKGTAREFGNLWLELLPATPPLRRGQCTVRLLRSMADVLGYGRALRNCLRQPEVVLTYLVALRCLVAVEGDSGRPLALVAVLLERTGADLLPQTDEVLGAQNRPPSANVISAAEEFVDRLAGQSTRFEHFVRVGEALGRLAKVSED